MIRSVWKYLFLVVLASFFTYSCIKKKTYPTAPEIEYKDFLLYPGDTASLVIKFTDGDGDIGVSSTDSTQTLFYTYYYYDNDLQKFRAYYSSSLGDTLRTGYVVRSPTDSYKGKPISGEFSIRLQEYRHSTDVKRLKYVVVLYDNAGHKSAPITTSEINVP
jgi:hypothetical protein